MSGLTRKSFLWKILCVLVMLGGFALTGCTVDTGGQTLPSQFYLTDDVQYFAPGREFILANEAAAMKAHKEEMQAEAVSQPQP